MNKESNMANCYQGSETWYVGTSVSNGFYKRSNYHRMYNDYRDDVLNFSNSSEDMFHLNIDVVPQFMQPH